VRTVSQGNKCDYRRTQGTSTRRSPQFTNLLSARLTKKLEDRLGLNPDVAKWAVESWCFALGLNLPAASESKEEIGDLAVTNVGTPDLQAPDLETTDLHAARTTQLKEANKKIKIAWITGCFCGGLNLIVALSSNVPVMLIDVFLYFGLSFGIYKKNKICAVIMFVYFILSKILTIELLTRNAFAPIVAASIAYFFFQGIKGTFAYDQITKTHSV
jgi:hypothetical protein